MLGKHQYKAGNNYGCEDRSNPQPRTCWYVRERNTRTSEIVSSMTEKKARMTFKRLSMPPRETVTKRTSK